MRSLVFSSQRDSPSGAGQEAWSERLLITRVSPFAHVPAVLQLRHQKQPPPDKLQLQKVLARLEESGQPELTQNGHLHTELLHSLSIRTPKKTNGQNQGLSIIDRDLDFFFFFF